VGSGEWGVQRYSREREVVVGRCWQSKNSPACGSGGGNSAKLAQTCPAPTTNRRMARRVADLTSPLTSISFLCNPPSK
jgi:hypothetical protein